MRHKELIELYKSVRAQYGFKDELVRYYGNLIICIANGKPHKAVTYDYKAVQQ